MSEHVVTRFNDGWYVCDECGDTGSERWAILHQFPTSRIVMEGPLHPGPGSEPLQQAAADALGVWGSGGRGERP